MFWIGVAIEVGIGFLLMVALDVMGRIHEWRERLFICLMWPVAVGMLPVVVLVMAAVRGYPRMIGWLRDKLGVQVQPNPLDDYLHHDSKDREAEACDHRAIL